MMHRIRKQGWRAVHASLLMAGACLAASTAAAATPLLNFEFNEGSGTKVTDSVAKLEGALGLPVDPANDPVVVIDSPAGAAGDRAVSLNVGNATGQGFLVVDDGGAPILALATNAFTIEAWVKIDPNDTRSAEGIGAYGSSYKLGLVNGELTFTLYGLVDIPSGLMVPLDSWHHVAAAWVPGVGVTFYLDGGSETAVAETRLPRAFANNYLTIGAEGVGGNALQGVIDRFRIHQAVLTAAQLDSVAGTPKAALASTLVAYNFNEAKPPYANAGGAARPAIISNDYLATSTRPTFITDTPSGKTGDFALNFKAGQEVQLVDANSVVTLDQNDPSFTLQAWVKFGAQPQARSVFFWHNAPGGALSFSVTQDRRVFVTTLGVLDAQSAAFIPDDNGWHHIAVVHENGKEIRFYVDGTLGDTLAYTGGVIFTRTDTTVILGSEPGGGNQYLGSLDRFKFTSGVLTPAQLDAWPIPGVQPGAPSLAIENTVLVSWPTASAGYLLQSSTDLGDVKNWTTVTNKPSVGTQGYYVLVPTTATKVFYRLYKP